MNSLKNKTLFVSGASRGIGLAIAKKAAADGANVILAAKTAEPHPKLPGTIYTAAAETNKVLFFRLFIFISFKMKLSLIFFHKM
jgi:citronellol/citronellal dehydrogenase